MVVLINAGGRGLIISAQRCEPIDLVNGDPKKGQGLCTGSQVADEDYAAVSEILQTRQGFSLNGYKVLTMKRRLAARVRAAGYNDLKPYIDLLRQNEREQQCLLTALSVHVSQFFRNPSAFSLLKKKVLPLLFSQARQTKGKVRIWSAGCAYGEEAYTLAMICDGLKQDGDLIALMATDLSLEAVKIAKRGVYPEERLKDVSPELKARWFIAQGKNYQLVTKLKEQVKFFRHDILAEQPFYRVDLILCRNLLIYFTRDQQRQILERLAATLTLGGYLMLGRAETMTPDCRNLFSCVDPVERLYQRVGDSDLITN
jgi:chemotaxis protein methyltransferase CheR